MFFSDCFDSSAYKKETQRLQHLRRNIPLAKFQMQTQNHPLLSLAGSAGFEPAGNGVKVRCVTASPRAYILSK